MAQMVLVPAIVTTASVLPFAAELASQLERNDAIELDLAAVADADVSFLQLVCAARRQAEHDGKSLRLAHPVHAELTALSSAPASSPISPQPIRLSGFTETCRDDRIHPYRR